MYGILVSYVEYLDTKTSNTIEQLLEKTDNVQGIFTGRYEDFVILGKILEYVDGSKNPHLVPELSLHERMIIEKQINEKFGVTGEAHYYFIKK
jgi:hypothetical protein